MARYIDAELIKPTIKEYIYRYIDDEVVYNDLVDIAADIKDLIKNIPTADVFEVKHGHWFLPPDGISSIRCSECNTPALWEHDDDDYGYAEKRCISHYCPNCGAKMEGDVK